MNKSYDSIFGNGRFTDWFDKIAGVLICFAASFCLTEVLFSFDFKVNFQKALIFSILFLFFLRVFFYFIKQRRYKLFDGKIVFGARETEILYHNIHSLVFTLADRPGGIYNLGLGEPYLWIKEQGEKNYICTITIYLIQPDITQKSYKGNLSTGTIKSASAYRFNCYDRKSIFHLLDHSEATVYVTKSFLLANRWTINGFCEKYHIALKKVQLINDGN